MSQCPKLQSFYHIIAQVSCLLGRKMVVNIKLVGEVVFFELCLEFVGAYASISCPCAPLDSMRLEI